MTNAAGTRLYAGPQHMVLSGVLAQPLGGPPVGGTQGANGLPGRQRQTGQRPLATRQWRVGGLRRLGILTLRAGTPRRRPDCGLPLARFAAVSRFWGWARLRPLARAPARLGPYSSGSAKRYSAKLTPATNS